jgi:hypothetical protein
MHERILVAVDGSQEGRHPDGVHALILLLHGSAGPSDKGGL